MNQMTRMFAIGISLLLLAIAAPAANAFVTATPSYYDFGSVNRGQSSWVTINFWNNSREEIRSFTVHCSGDLSAFSCMSRCYSLPAFGICSVEVQFTPRNEDGLRRMVWLSGSGGGSFATSTVYGTDARPYR